MGREGVFLKISAEVMNREYGIPLEVLDAPGFVGKFEFMGGIEGWVEPGQLKGKVEMRGFGECLKGRKVEELQYSPGDKQRVTGEIDTYNV
jgi:hypothetical protein